MELIEDSDDAHRQIPSREGGGIGHVELRADICIKHHAEACLHNILEGQEVILLSNECSLDHVDGGWGRPLRIYRRRSGVMWGGECHPFKKIIGGRINCKARPSVDGTLRAKELGEHFDNIFAEGANVSKI
jgi:hypothetical protein